MADRIGSVVTGSYWNNPGSTSNTLADVAVPVGTNRAVAIIVAASNPSGSASDMIPGATIDGNAAEELAGMYPANNVVAQSKCFGFPIADGVTEIDIVLSFTSPTSARVWTIVFLKDVDPADLADAVSDFNNNGANANVGVTIAEDDTVNGYVLGWTNWRNATAVSATESGDGDPIANLTIDQTGATNYDTGLAVIESKGDASVAAAWTLSATITAQARGLRFNHLQGADPEPEPEPPAADPGTPIVDVTDIELWSGFAAAGGTRLHFLPEALGETGSAVATYRLMDVDELVIKLPAGEKATAARPRRVLRTVTADGDYDEWLILKRRRIRNAGGSVVELTAYSIEMLLTTAGIVTRVEANGATIPTFEQLGLPASGHLGTFIRAALDKAGYTWIQVGTITPVVPVDLVYQWSNPLELLHRLAELTECEWRLRRDGGTRYLIDLIPQIASSAPLVRVRDGLNLQALDHLEEATTQGTRIYVQGQAGSDGIHATMARNRWRVTAVAGLVVTVVDPGGGAGPVALDAQWIGYTLAPIGGTAREITASSTDLQTVTLEDVTGISIGTMVEFRGQDGEDLLYCPVPASIETDYGVVTRVVERPDVPSTVNLVPNPAMRLYGNPSGPPDGWSIEGSPVITRNDDRRYWRVGGLSARIETNADGEGIRTATVPITPTATSPFFSGFMSTQLLSGRIRWELVVSTPGGTVIYPLNKVFFTTQTGVWVYDGEDGLGVETEDLFALGATSCFMRMVQDGPGTAVFYVEAGQITQTAVQVPFIDGSGPTQLMQEGNRKVRERALPGVRLEIQMVDLSEAQRELWNSYQLTRGGPIEVDEAEHPVLTTTRLVEVQRDLKRRTLVKVALSSRPEDLVDAIVRPRLPHRLPRTADTSGLPSVDFAQEEVPGSPGQRVVTLTSRPAGARVYYLVQDQGDATPVVGGAAYQAGPVSGAPVRITVNLLQAENVQISAYAVLGSTFSPLRTWTIDANTLPSLTLGITEPFAGVPRYTAVVDDDVVEWHLYRRGHATAWPTADGTQTHPVLDEQFFVGRIRVRSDGGAFNRVGAPLAGMVDGAGAVWTGIGGLAWQESGIAGGTIIRAIAVGFDRNGNISARAYAQRTVAGAISPALTAGAQSALTDSAGGALSDGEAISANLTWGVNAAVVNATHDLRISQRLDGGPWEVLTTVANPVSPLSLRVATGQVYRTVKHDPIRTFEYLLELIQTSGGAVLDSRVTGPQSASVNPII